MTENTFKVKLVNQTLSSFSTAVAETVVFNVTPDVVETRNVNYRTLEPVHMPGQIYVYGGTSSRTFNLSNVRLISRTVNEATLNQIYLQRLRGWSMPRFGINSSTLTKEQAALQRKLNQAVLSKRPNAIKEFDEAKLAGKLGEEQLGSPPPVLFFSAYSNTPIGTSFGQSSQASLKLENIRRVPTVIQQLSIPYPSDVDYIPTENGTPFPTIMTLDMVLLETHSPSEFNKFSLNDFKTGTLKGF